MTNTTETETNGILRRLFSAISGKSKSDTKCKHETIRNGWPDDDESIWYVLNTEKTGEEWWSETDAAYIHLYETKTEFVCLGCGEEETILTAERFGGSDGIKPKSDMGDETLLEFRNNVHSGGFYNGWPDDYPTITDGGRDRSVETEID